MTSKDMIMKLPERVKPEAIENHETIFHFSFSGEGGGDFTVEIKDGKCTVAEGHHGNPKCTVKSKGADFVKIVKGEINPMMAMMTGKLNISNTGELLKYAEIFGFL
jgi:putative sterol carrier protein